MPKQPKRRKPHPNWLVHTTVICERRALTLLQNKLRLKGSNVSEWFRRQVRKETKGRRA